MPIAQQTLNYSFTSFYPAILTQILVKPGLNGLKAATPLLTLLNSTYMTRLGH